MMKQENQTKVTVAPPIAIQAQPEKTADEIIEEILRAAGLEAVH